jgi:hypothetical protein
VNHIESNGAKALEVYKKRWNSERIIRCKPKFTRKESVNVWVFVSLTGVIARVDVDRVPECSKLVG